MDHIEKLGIAEDTLFIWTADNGGLRSNAPMKGLKNDAYEGGHRIPNMVAWGAQDETRVHQKRMPLKPGRLENRPYIHQDWMPTLLSLAGAQHPKSDLLDGYDITELLSGKDIDSRPEQFFWHEPNFWMHSGPESSIREGRWKLTYFYAKQQWELYDLNADIGEKNNLLRKFPEISDRLARKLIKHLEDNEATYPIDIKSGAEQPPLLPSST